MFLFGRSINYDERDPFLCNACGFCKYAKFDYTLTARPCCAVDPIENEEDRKKVVMFAKKNSQTTGDGGECVCQSFRVNESSGKDDETW